MVDGAKRDALQRQLEGLPAGKLAKKNVKGHECWHLRFREDSKRRERYVPLDEVDRLREQLELRAALEQEPSRMGAKASSAPTPTFAGNVLVGEDLREFARPVARFKRRALFGRLPRFLSCDPADKVPVLCG